MVIEAIPPFAVKGGRGIFLLPPKPPSLNRRSLSEGIAVSPAVGRLESAR